MRSEELISEAFRLGYGYRLALLQARSGCISKPALAVQGWLASLICGIQNTSMRALPAELQTPVAAQTPAVEWLVSERPIPYPEGVAFMEARADAIAPGLAAPCVWLLEHPPVFTQGLNGDPSHVLAAGDIPVVQIDRGGQVTYHGPGQLVVYPLIDIRRAGLGVRDLVTALERAVIAYCKTLGIDAECRKNAPGVYVSGQKIASVGLRIRRGASYHGLAFNVNMDLEPFQRINPCGYAGLQMTQLAALGQPEASVEAVGRAFVPFLEDALAKLRAKTPV